MLRLFYKFPISKDPLKFLEMELEDDDGLGTMITIYCPTEMENPSSVELFGEIAEPDLIQVRSIRRDPDLDDIPEDIDEEGLVEGENANPHLAGNMGLGIILRNSPGLFMTDVDPDATLAREFPEYTNIVPAHLLDDEISDEVVCRTTIR
ncbi:hypothetical protein J1N35_004398 [Gossypium stocksii]|uniref:Uncharacterized protein n=1 Tax=Gossypium stocksii TaxID=47602 RepID=A0A9D3WDJ4_9ROSI|nr:hypothetical protein J1N35_004398 [Gossypium stocksii]